MLKLFINQFYQNIWVEVKQHNKTVVCKYCNDITLPNISKTEWSFVLGNIKGISVCKEEDKFDFVVGKRIAIKSFIIKAYGNIKAHNMAKYKALTKKFNHERKLQTYLQDKVRMSLSKVETMADIDKSTKQLNEEKHLVWIDELEEIGYKYKPCSRCGNIPALKHNSDINERLYHIVCNCCKSVTNAPSIEKAIETWNVMN